MANGSDREALAHTYLDWVRERALAQGLTDADRRRFELANPTTMSVDGIMRYWRKRM